MPYLKPLASFRSPTTLKRPDGSKQCHCRQFAQSASLASCIIGTLGACDHWAVTALLFYQLLHLVHLRQPPLIHEQGRISKFNRPEKFEIKPAHF